MRKTARQKLNQASVLGAFTIGGLVGWLTESFTIFVIVVILLVVAGLHAGDIRIQPRSGR